MNKIFFGLVLGASVGCMQFQPTGPLSEFVGRHYPGGTHKEQSATPTGPVTVSAARPIPPAILITPGDVNPDDPAGGVQKFMNELEYDKKTTPEPSRTSEISVIPGRSE